MNVTGTAVLLFAVLLLPSTLAASVTITANQTDYYFAVGQNATLSLPVSSTLQRGDQRYNTGYLSRAAAECRKRTQYY